MPCMTELTLETLRAELAPIRQQLDALPLLRRAIDVLQHDTRDLRTAFNEFARAQVTPGEVASLQLDIDRLQETTVELQHRLATVERLLNERQP